jgi:membrane-associated phospholipid phosphatase
MTDREVQRAAEFLAAHALLLLVLGLALAAAALAAVAGAVRMVHRHQPAIRAFVSAALSRARQLESVDRWLPRSRAFVPGSYLVLHLVLGLALTGAVAVFVVIAEDVTGGGGIARFDLAFAQALRDTATPGWDQFFAGVSWFGAGMVLAIATAIVAVRLLLTGNRRLAAVWIAAQAGGGVLNLILKETFARTRPHFADPLLAASSWSFPSGHAMGTFILVGFGCYLLLRNRRSWTTAAVVATLALAWGVAMAFSRLYLGVHYASDVLAGAIAGVAWVAVCASAFEVVRRLPVPPRRP